MLVIYLKDTNNSLVKRAVCEQKGGAGCLMTSEAMVLILYQTVYMHS